MPNFNVFDPKVGNDLHQPNVNGFKNGFFLKLHNADDITIIESVAIYIHHKKGGILWKNICNSNRFVPSSKFTSEGNLQSGWGHGGR